MALKFYFLINPISGGGQGKVIKEFLPEIMESMGFVADEWKVEFTRYEGMKEQILTALSSTETLIAVGGDGTVSAVLSTMLAYDFSNKVKIGLIPLGTGNDLARVLNLYKPFVDQGLLFLVRRLLRASAEPFDIWKVNGTYALANYFSGGIDARIAHDFNRPQGAPDRDCREYPEFCQRCKSLFPFEYGGRFFGSGGCARFAGVPVCHCYWNRPCCWTLVQKIFSQVDKGAFPRVFF